MPPKNFQAGIFIKVVRPTLDMINKAIERTGIPWFVANRHQPLVAGGIVMKARPGKDAGGDSPKKTEGVVG